MFLEVVKKNPVHELTIGECLRKKSWDFIEDKYILITR